MRLAIFGIQWTEINSPSLRLAQSDRLRKEFARFFNLAVVRQHSGGRTTRTRVQYLRRARRQVKVTATRCANALAWLVGSAGQVESKSRGDEQVPARRDSLIPSGREYRGRLGADPDGAGGHYLQPLSQHVSLAWQQKRCDRSRSHRLVRHSFSQQPAFACGQGACGHSHGTLRQRFTHTSSGTHTLTRLQTVTGTHSVTV